MEGAETAGVPYGIGVDGAAATGIIGTDVATDFDTGMGAATGVGWPAKSIGSCSSALRCIEEPIANDSHPTRTPSGDQ